MSGGQAASSLWLDKLPSEVCDRIMLFACRSEQCATALSLAKLSAMWRGKVRSMLNHHLELRLHDSEDASTRRDWISVCAGDIETACLVDPVFAPDDETVLIVFSSPKLRLVRILGYPNCLTALEYASSVRVAHIVFREKVSERQLLYALTNIRLEKLELYCRPKAEAVCLFQEELFRAGSISIKECCPNLTSLKVTCGCSRNSLSKFWNVLLKLSILREVTIDGNLCCKPYYGPYDGGNLAKSPIPVHAKEFLAGMESVRLHGLRVFRRRFVEFGSAVTEIVANTELGDNRFTNEQLSLLPMHTRLRKLHADIPRGGEEIIEKVVHKTPELQSLGLWWGRYPCRGSHGYARAYPDASPGVLLRIVRAMPQLSELRLGQVRIPLSEVTAIMSSGGPRLRALEMPILQQEESPCIRLEHLLCTSALHNRALRTLYVTAAPLSIRNSEPSEEWQAKSERLDRCLRRLEQGAPYLCGESLHDLGQFARYLRPEGQMM